ncbi:VCBS repeat-containing protein, partial [bacterium]|nr:VCBS repeat-containing protein [bacterium]
TDSGIGAGLPNSLGNGNSWADYDNDGDMDVFLAGNLVSNLYRNDGGQFTKITGHGLSGTNDNGFAAAWGDYDNDSFVDLIIASPFGFGPTHPNVLYHNNGDGTFEKIDTSVVTMGLAAYTIPSWFDYDQDGDIDLFIGTGPITQSGGPDYFFKNMLKETGTAFFTRITSGNFATDLRDGQNVNWVDYDNDQDLDMYVTNYGSNGGAALRQNNLYRNEGGGVFTKITNSPLTTDVEVSLGNLWADFDNDGDQDCFVTNEGFANNPSRYYRNDGGGNFTRMDGILLTVTGSGANGATAGDYDADGDLDLFIYAFPGGFRRFYRNDQPPGNHWLRMRLTGTVSNRASLGARVRAKANIGGTSVWQYRELSAQNTFCGHNALEIHFGFGDAATIDSLEVIWPSGTIKYLTQVKADQILNLIENTDEGAIPNFSAVETDTAYQDFVFQKTVRAFAHPDPVYRLIQFPSGMDIDSLSGLITWTPAEAQFGNHTIIVEAGNAFGTDTVSFSISAQNGLIPQAASISERLLFSGWLWKDTVIVTANPQAGFTLLNGPTGLTIGAQTGIISWQPSNAQVGETLARVRIFNSLGADTLEIPISVFSPPQISILQNPVLTQYANIVVNSTALLAQAPVMNLSVSIASPNNPLLDLIPGTDRSYRSDFRFINSGTLSITAAVTSMTGASASPGRTYQVVLAKQGTLASVFTPDGIAKVRTTAVEPEDIYWTAVSFQNEGETVCEFGPVREFQQDLILSFKVTSSTDAGGKIFELAGAGWVEVPGVMMKNGWLEARVSRTGTFKAVFSKTDFSAIPTEIKLHSNYPNPFNPSTTIGYAIHKNTDVSIAVYNVFGQKVKTLVRGNQPAGYHQVIWDSTNDNGAQVASGVYYYRLETAGFSETRKMLLIK